MNYIKNNNNKSTNNIDHGNEDSDVISQLLYYCIRGRRTKKCMCSYVYGTEFLSEIVVFTYSLIIIFFNKIKYYKF